MQHATHALQISCSKCQKHTQVFPIVAIPDIVRSRPGGVVKPFESEGGKVCGYRRFNKCVHTQCVDIRVIVCCQWLLAERKLVELLTVGRVENLHYRMENELHMACKELVTLFGIGPIRARQLAQPPNCIHGIDDLKRRVADGSWKGLHYRGRAILEADSLLCLGYYDDLQERIPRGEVEEIIEFVHAAAERVYGKDNVSITCCGSYRRGKSTSGDVDILVSTQVLIPWQTVHPGSSYLYTHQLFAGEQRIAKLHLLAGAAPCDRFDCVRFHRWQPEERQRPSPTTSTQSNSHGDGREDGIEGIAAGPKHRCCSVAPGKAHCDAYRLPKRAMDGAEGIPA